MWKDLGWDMSNEQGYAEQYKDVIHEDAIKINADAFTKPPDYCFRIGGVRKFFLEAKNLQLTLGTTPRARGIPTDGFAAFALIGNDSARAGNTLAAAAAPTFT